MRMRTFSRPHSRNLALKVLAIPALAVIWCAVMGLGCARTAPGLKSEALERINPWTHLNLRNNPEDFHFAIVADLTAGLRPGVFESAVEKMNLLQPEFVLSVGDFIEGVTTDTAKLDREWDEFDGWVKQLEMPFFYVPGNHDISNPIMAAKWRERHGRTYYHFVYRNVLFLCLDTEDPPSCSIGDEQMDYLRKILDANRRVRWTFVFMHRPTWLPDFSNRTPKNGEKFEAMLADRPFTIFAGHDHKYSTAERNGRRCYVLSTTGAQGRGPDFTTSKGNRSKELLGLDKGEFDHLVWVTMTADGPRIANLLLDGILTDNLQTASK